MPQANPEISIVIPAHNEEKFIPKCLSAIRLSADTAGLAVETVVVLNRCTDSTGAIATEFGAKIVSEDAKNIARIRNAGVVASNSPIIVTIDADSYMSETTLGEIKLEMSASEIVAGGANFKAERGSIPIHLSYGLAKLAAKLAGGSMALYWFRRTDFDAIGGFDENRHVGEDIDFSSRLSAYVKKSGGSYVMLRNSHTVTSCRKFDQFGDWHAIKLFLFQNSRVKSMTEGSNTEDLDKYYYEARRKK